MPTLHLPVLIVLLLIPNTTWRDWYAARSEAAPTALQRQISRLLYDPHGQCALAVMNARTADTDRITPSAGERTLLAGARLRSGSSDTTAVADLGYGVLPGNLQRSLAESGITTQPADSGSAALVGSDSAAPKPGPRGEFILATLSTSDSDSAGQISEWRNRVAAAGSRGALILASPNPTPAEYEARDQLTPLLIWRLSAGRAALPPALLYSPSTRVSGLVANTDVAATIAALAGAPLIGPSFGSPCVISVEASRTKSLSALGSISARAGEQARRQAAVPLLAAALAALIALASALTATRSHAVFGRVLACSAATVPVILLVAQSWQQAALTWTLLLASASAIIAGAAFTWDKSLSGSEHAVESRLRWIAPAAAMVSLAVVACDTLFNHARLTAMSLLGYSPLEGARYYGLGNEAMGVVAGAVAVCCCTGLARVKTDQAAAFPAQVATGAALWCAAGALLAAPALGAKAGSVPVFAVGLGSYLFAGRMIAAQSTASSADARRLRRKTALVALAATIAVILLIAAVAGAVHLRHSTSDTHISVITRQASRFGYGVYAQAVLRKSAMDAHLVLHSVWMLVLTAASAGTWFHLHREGTQNARRPELVVGIAVTLACLLFNDAGVVAAALCGCIFWGYLLTSPD